MAALSLGAGPALIQAAKGRAADDEVGSAVDAAVAAIAAGGIVVVTDDDDRENEGDLTMAAAFCGSEQMGFFIRHSSGIVCVPLDAATAHRLRLDPMVTTNDAPLATAFTVSVDAKQGLTTGISGEQRAATVRALADPNASAADFVRPGHVFPLVARDGGVLVRSGHTEAAGDLCRLAGLPPIGVIAELMNDDGTVMAGEELGTFVDRHGLPRVSVSQLIAFRQRSERLVRRISSFPVDTPSGPMTCFTYATVFDSLVHFAFVMGDIAAEPSVATRIHRADVVSDVIGGGGVVSDALRYIGSEKRGVLLYLRDAGGTHPELPRGNGGESTRRSEWREVGLGAQILADLGVTSIKLLTGTPRRYVGLEGFGIKIDGWKRIS